MKKYEEKTGVEPGPYIKVWYGLPASILAGVVACPFDVVKTRIQGVRVGGMCDVISHLCDTSDGNCLIN